MLSRRQLLAAALGGVGLGGLGYGVNHAVHRGTVSEKWVKGIADDGEDVVHAVVLDSLDTPYVVESNESLGLFSDGRARRPVATDEDHAELEGHYESVEYGLTVCPADETRDCRSGAASRADYNSVQVGDEVRAVAVDDRLRLL